MRHPPCLNLTHTLARAGGICVIGIIVSWMLAGRVALAQPATTPSVPATHPATKPASRSASRPATAPVFTLGTPKDALKYFAAALRDGDAERLRNAVLCTDDAEERMVTAIADMSRALSTLHQSAAQAYGVDAARRFTDDTAAGFDQTVARIDAAEVTVEDASAIVRYADAKENPYELRRVGDEWKVPATQFTHGAKPPALDRRVIELSVQTRIVRDLGEEIAAGKHKNAEAAGLAWRSKMMSALAGEGATTRPSSRPRQ